MVISTTAPVSEAEYREFALGDPQGHWELHRGQLREKPGMSAAHDNVIDRLQRRLYMQLSEHEYRLRSNNARLRVPRRRTTFQTWRSFQLSSCSRCSKVPTRLMRTATRCRWLSKSGLPQPATTTSKGKLPDYQQRGDREIWFIHPRRAHADRLAQPFRRHVRAAVYEQRNGAAGIASWRHHRP